MIQPFKEQIVKVLEERCYIHHTEGKVISENEIDDIAEDLVKIISFNPPVSGLCRPKERAVNCPNCGTLHWESELNYSSQKKIVVKNGTYCNTLYGVCKDCADRHSR